MRKAFPGVVASSYQMRVAAPPDTYTPCFGKVHSTSRSHCTIFSVALHTFINYVQCFVILLSTFTQQSNCFSLQLWCTVIDYIWTTGHPSPITGTEIFSLLFHNSDFWHLLIKHLMVARRTRLIITLWHLDNFLVARAEIFS